MKYCVSTYVGTWTNWLTFEPDPDYYSRCRNRIAFSDIVQALLRGILRRENPTYTYWRPAAAVRRGFKMVLFTESSEHLCRRYMRSTECPSSSILKWLHYIFFYWLRTSCVVSKSQANFCHAMLCTARTMLSQDLHPFVRLSVCPFICHTPVFYWNGYTYHQTFSLPGSHTTSLSIPNGMTILRQDPPLNGGIETIGDMKQSRLSANISLYLGNNTRQSHSY